MRIPEYAKNVPENLLHKGLCRDNCKTTRFMILTEDSKPNWKLARCLYCHDENLL